jgi:DNA-binding NarL/FixJ family response regulator
MHLEDTENKKIRVILADDHAVLREGTRRLLDAENDIEVVGEAENGEDAIKLVSQFSPDVILLDIAMPKLNGVEAAKQIKKISPRTAILILTAYDLDQCIFPVLDAGAAGYLLKNVRGKELVNAIRAVSKGEAVLYPSVTRKVLNRFAALSSKQAELTSEERLTEREVEILNLAAEGLSNKEISDKLFLSIRTVQTHLNKIFHKLNAGSRTEAVIQGIKKGIINIQATSSESK